MITQLQRSHGFEALNVTGEVPEDLKGRFYRAGPGAIERFAQKVHPFLADGAIHAVEFGQEVTGASRMLETEEYLQEQQQGRFLSGKHASLWRRGVSALTHHVKATGNTNLMPWQGRLFALMEAGLPVELDANTLTAHKKPTNFDLLQHNLSAHPHRVHSLNTSFNFGVDGQTVIVYAFPDKGPAREVGRFEQSHVGLIHDFIATEHHIIFFLDPAKINTWRAATSTGDMGSWFSWDKSGTSQIVVMPLNNPSQVARFDLEAFRVWHFVNAYSAGNTIVIDAVRHDDIGAIYAPVGDASAYTAPKLFRYLVNLNTHTVKAQPMWTTSCEFPRIRPCDEGQHYQDAWLQTFDDEHGNTGFAHFDLHNGSHRRYFSPPGVVTSEPIFVPTANSSTKGYILQFENTDEATNLVIHDSVKFTQMPLAVVHLSQPLPPTFHGVFVSS